MSGSVRKSIPRQKTVHGVVVRRLPIGAYLDAAESIRELPENLLGRLFPDMSPEEAYLQLKYLRTDTVMKIIGRGASALPDELLAFFGALLDISPDTIRNKLTPSEFMDIACEFWEMNKLANFIKRVRGAVRALR